MLLCDPFQGGTDGWKDPQSYRARALLHRRELGARGFAETAPGKERPACHRRGAQMGDVIDQDARCRRLAALSPGLRRPDLPALSMIARAAARPIARFIS